MEKTSANKSRNESLPWSKLIQFALLQLQVRDRSHRIKESSYVLGFLIHTLMYVSPAGGLDT